MHWECILVQLQPYWFSLNLIADDLLQCLTLYCMHLLPCQQSHRVKWNVNTNILSCGRNIGVIDRYISCPNAFVSLLLVCRGNATERWMREEKTREKGKVGTLIGTSHFCVDSFVNSPRTPASPPPLFVIDSQQVVAEWRCQECCWSAARYC